MKLWKLISKLEVQPWTKIFLWRANRNILPMRSMLISKGIEVRNNCYLCGAQVESIHHLLFDCKYMKETFNVLDVMLPNRSVPNDPLDWLHLMQDALNSYEINSEVFYG